MAPGPCSQCPSVSVALICALRVPGMWAASSGALWPMSAPEAPPGWVLGLSFSWAELLLGLVSGFLICLVSPETGWNP